jgi:hypothetical protein
MRINGVPGMLPGVSSPCVIDSSLAVQLEGLSLHISQAILHMHANMHICLMWHKWYTYVTGT